MEYQIDKQAQLKQAIEKYCEALTKCGAGKIMYRKGRKFYKIGRVSSIDEIYEVEAFVDMEGNLYKPTSFKAPAKGVRYNLLTELEIVLKNCDPFGAYLYRNYRRKS